MKELRFGLFKYHEDGALVWENACNFTHSHIELDHVTSNLYLFIFYVQLIEHFSFVLFFAVTDHQQSFIYLCEEKKYLCETKVSEGKHRGTIYVTLTWARLNRS